MFAVPAFLHQLKVIKIKLVEESFASANSKCMLKKYYITVNGTKGTQHKESTHLSFQQRFTTRLLLRCP